MVPPLCVYVESIYVIPTVVASFDMVPVSLGESSWIVPKSLHYTRPRGSDWSPNGEETTPFPTLPLP